MEETHLDNITIQFDNIIEGLSVFRSQTQNLQQQIKTLEKNIKKEFRVLKKEAEKNRNKGNKKPSGFAKPTEVSPELCEFMNCEKGCDIARTDVTKALIQYIQENKLHQEENKKVIKPDEKLKALLGIDDDNQVPLTYFNIQQYMNKHFISSKKKTILMENEI
jgi:chromatin remodeling complex protein RSC6